MADNDANAPSAEAVDAGAVYVDPAQTLALAQASVAAYNDFEGLPITPPTDYQLYSRFTGWDPFSGAEESFGLIFRYNGPATVVNRFIVAFRGTDSLSDILDDALWGLVPFAPYKNSVTPTPNVHQGFYEIYSEPSGQGPIVIPALRTQIFTSLPTHLAEVLITGHSLGAALSQLFTLDMRVSFPDVNIKTINFASPMVGDADWATACNTVGATAKITRVINYWDYVPDYPLDWNYVTIGAQFQTAFSGPDYVAPIDELPRHSLLNLQTVLTHCVYLPSQIWTGSFLDAAYGWYYMASTAPPSASKAELLAKRKELQDLEAAVRAGAAGKSPA